MHEKRFSILTNTIKRLVRYEARGNLLRLLEKTRPEDIAHAFYSLSKAERAFLFDAAISDVRMASLILNHLDEKYAREILTRYDVMKVKELIESLPSDDAASLINLLPEEEKNEILNMMSNRRSENIEEILTYQDKTAGSIMDKSFFTVRKDLTVKEVIDMIRSSKEKENLFYIYVVNESGQLIGVLSLRQLFMADESSIILDIMNPDVISVASHMDQEEVAKIIDRYDFVAVPVVDEFHRVIGVVTVDDVLDIIQDETTEDIYKMAGLYEEHAGEVPMKSAKTRSFWLLANLLIDGFLVSEFIRGSQDIIRDLTILAGFIPVITATAGSAGNQSSTVMIRGLATGRVDLHGFPRHFLREVKIGAIIGLFYGIFLFFYIFLRDGFILNIGLIVGVSLFSAILTAAVTGSLIPIIMFKLKIDPAVASVPFVTAFMDIAGVVIYFSIARLLLLTGLFNG